MGGPLFSRSWGEGGRTAVRGAGPPILKAWGERDSFLPGGPGGGVRARATSPPHSEIPGTSSFI